MDVSSTLGFPSVSWLMSAAVLHSPVPSESPESWENHLSDTLWQGKLGSGSRSSFLERGFCTRVTGKEKLV